MEFEGARQRGRPRKKWKEVADKDVHNLLIKPSGAVDRNKRKRMIRGNWSDRSIDSDAESCKRTFWCRLNQVNLDLRVVKRVIFLTTGVANAWYLI